MDEQLFKIYKELEAYFQAKQEEEKVKLIKINSQLAKQTEEFTINRVTFLEYIKRE